MTDVAKIKLSNARKGMKFSDEHKLHLKEARQRRILRENKLRR
jgi:hypothetical protein